MSSTKITIRIEKLVYGGAGLARTDQGVVFVDRVLPGELVEVEVFDKKKDYSRARLSDVLEPSESRRVPVCPNFETVGCCGWGHIQLSRQLEIREEILRESLRRGARILWDNPIETIRSPEGGYRMRAVFHVAGKVPGFLREGTHEVVPIETCAALMPSISKFLIDAAEALAAGRFAGADRIAVISSPKTDRVAATFFRGRRKASWSGGTLTTDVEGFTYRLRPTGFFQPNRYTLSPLHSRVTELAGDAGVMLDLFCGDAFFTLPLAKHAVRVVGVDRRSTANARKNARLNSIVNLDFIKASAQAYLKTSEVHPEVVVLDPPRSGAGPTLTRGVAGLGASRIVYVSCNPTTFAADAGVLNALGYRLGNLTLVDQFPNTPHIETIATFDK